MGNPAVTDPAPEEPVDLFTYQQRTFPVLLGWSMGSVLSGWLWRRAGDGFWRGLGDQFIGWGLVDGLIAGVGLNGARNNAARFRKGQFEHSEYARQRRNFSLIVALNIFLDLGYMLAGRSLVNRSGEDYRRGLGWGILVQGGFLFIWDVLLLLLLPRKRRDHEA